MKRAPGEKLTSFQIRCEAVLTDALEQAGLELLDRCLGGIDETYVTARIAGTSLDVFIYEDEAQTHGGEVALFFEAQDFRSPDLLISEFVRLTVAAARNES